MDDDEFSSGVQSPFMGGCDCAVGGKSYSGGGLAAEAYKSFTSKVNVAKGVFAAITIVLFLILLLMHIFGASEKALSNISMLTGISLVLFWGADVYGEMG